MSRTADAVELEELLRNIHRLARRNLRHGLPGPRLRGAQVELLRLVHERPGVRVSEAAKELGLAGNSVSTLVRELLDLGLLTREADPQDGRAALLKPTPEAERRLREWQSRRRSLFRRHVLDLPDPDQAALAAALPALRKLAATLHDEAEAT